MNKNSNLFNELNQAESNGHSSVFDTVFALWGAESGDSLNVERTDETRWSEQPWVLSIEDDDDVALALQFRLKEIGVEMFRACAGREGYHRAYVDAPCAILLDYELPEGNGDYVLRCLKESSATRDIPVIVLTGRREARIERLMRDLGADEFITKPFEWRQLRNVLEKVLVSKIKNQADHIFN